MKELVVSHSQLPTIKKGLITGLEVAAGAKSSATHYHKREDQIEAVKNSVKNLYNISKELPLLVACQRGSTGFYIQQAMLNELKETTAGGSLNIVNPIDWYDEGLSDKALLTALGNLDRDHGITYVLRMFSSFKENSINNARARRLALGYIWSHPNLEFISIKYKNKIQNILKHLYGQRMNSILLKIATNYVRVPGILEGENSEKIFNSNFVKYLGNIDTTNAAKIFLFIFGKGHADTYDPVNFPIISEYFMLKDDIKKLNMIPEEVAQGLISDKAHPQYAQYWATESMRKATLAMIREKCKTTTANVVMRQTKKNESIGARKSANLTKVTDFLALYKTGYENGFTDEIREAIDDLAEKKKSASFPYDNVGIIIDDSESMKGHSTESKNTPRAIADFTAKVLTKSAKGGVMVTVDSNTTALAEAFIDLLEIQPADGFDSIFVLSDGYENTYEGMLNEVVNAWRNIDGSMVPVYHVSPITGAEVGAKARSLGDEISSLAISKPEALTVQLNAKLLEQDTKKWLEREIVGLGR